MDFRLTPDQRELRDGLRALLAGRFGPEQLRAAVDGRAGPDGILDALTGAGLFALRRPVRQDGLGLGLAEAVLAFEEAGRALVPGPLVATELAAAHSASGHGASGHGADGGAGLAGVVRTPRSDRGPLLVERLPSLSLLLVLDTGAGEVRTLDPARLTARQVRSLDPLTPLWELTAPLPRGELLSAADPELLWTEGTLLTAALQVGLATRAVETAVGYAKQREQFGRPIGAFQAVQQLCAEMLARVEPARAAVRAAALSGVGPGGPPDPVEVAGAKLLADEAAVRGARDCLQVHGGMGFTWEADVHLLLKRAWLLERMFAGHAECAEKLASGLLNGMAETYVGHLS
ncbi:acyl-CoA dehydrogenase family protein [Streptacidiphilus sp. N1-12]|uniref:Acyl-CoA dehydrogenase family protein n=2 Tax=Streptacidiphilus alkalitolerans TaxID=3342712 RepID=A0ABV6WCE6_9ACTN